MKRIWLLAVLVAGCAGGPKHPTIGGGDLYAHASELREHGSITLPASTGTLVVRRGQYLFDRSRDQIFEVDQVIAGCHGGSLADDTDCTAALLATQRFTVVDQPPRPRKLADEGRDLSDLNKARILVAAAGVGLAVGAAKCDAFDGCGEVLGIAAGLDGLLLLLLLAGPR